MSRKLPVIPAKQLISLMHSLGYEIIRQRGSHIRLERITETGVHKITVPNHNPIAIGTLNDILNKVAAWNQTSKDKLVEKL